MSFREINHKNNEEYWERLELVMERIEAVSEEEASSVEELYRGYFFEMSELFLVLYKLAEASLSGKLAEISTLEGKKINRRLYLDVQEDYADSYANPAYAVSKMGWEYGPLLSALDARLHGIYTSCMEGNIRYLCIYAELFVEIYNCFEDAQNLNGHEIRSLASLLLPLALLPLASHIALVTLSLQLNCAIVPLIVTRPMIGTIPFLSLLPFT